MVLGCTLLIEVRYVPATLNSISPPYHFPTATALHSTHFPLPLHTQSSDGLVKDDVSGSMYLFSDESLYEVSVVQEQRDMWKVYLQQQVWERVGSACS